MCLICVTGLTGAGKTSVSEAVARLGHMKIVEKITTRPQRLSDANQEYRFINLELYNQWQKEQRFALQTYFYGNHYAIERRILEQYKAQGVPAVITPWSFLGATVCDPGIECVCVHLEVSREERIRRMLARGDTQEFINQRLIMEENAEFAKQYQEYLRKGPCIVDNSKPFETVVGIVYETGLKFCGTSDTDDT